MDAATIEETNRIRVSLGMKPLPVPGAVDTASDSASEDEKDQASTLESRQAEGYDNFKKLQEAEAAKKRREDRAAAIRKARDQAQRFALLDGKGLGEAEDSGDMDTKSWLLGQKKRQKKIDKARKLEEELAAAEAAAAAAVRYTSKDLAGIKVAHDSTSFLDGDEQILTLKDSTIDQNDDEDELENFDLREQEKRADRLDLKKNKGYNPMNDDEDGAKGILSHYDEEIDGKKGKTFTLDESGAIGDLTAIMNLPTQDDLKPKAISLDDIVGDDAAPSSDYAAASQIKVKKPKKKKNKGTRQKQVDDDDIFPLDAPKANSESMDVDTHEPAPSRKRQAADDDLVDDDDLQATLAAQRRNALKKRKRVRPEDIAKQLREQEEEEEGSDPANEQQEGGLVIGEISEFVAGLSKPEDEEEERKPRRRKATTKTPDQDGDETMNEGTEAYAPTQLENDLVEAAAQEEVLDEEKTVGQGMGAALALLRERGLVKDGDAMTLEAHRAREDFLAKKRLLEVELDEQTRHQRERDRQNGKMDRMSQREREEYARQENQRRDFQQSKRMAELINKTYKPNVNIQYTDEHGRSLNQKEAFKQMSHQFHGKGSGKGKTEKTLKKIEDERKREAQSLFDASSAPGMSSAAQQQNKKRREAGVRLQ